MSASHYHEHYSPFKFANEVEIAMPHTELVKVKKAYVDEQLQNKKRTRDLGCTIPISEANLICSRPNAFISPNPPDVMRQAKSIFSF